MIDSHVIVVLGHTPGKEALKDAPVFSVGGDEPKDVGQKDDAREQ